MIATREITFISAAALLTIAGIILPLRIFSRQAMINHLLFHIGFSSVTLAEVAILENYNIFTNQFLNFNILGFKWLNSLFCILILDLLSYGWHRLNHTSKFLWKLHKFHHQTKVMDPLAAYRFHPIEVFLGYQIRTGVIWFLGFGLTEISLFVLIYGLLNLFQHSNLRLPSSVDTILCNVFVTPSLHHTHHLKDQSSQKSNYSTIFIFWDHLFKSYSAPGLIRENDIGLDWSTK